MGTIINLNTERGGRQILAGEIAADLAAEALAADRLAALLAALDGAAFPSARPSGAVLDMAKAGARRT